MSYSSSIYRSSSEYNWRRNENQMNQRLNAITYKTSSFKPAVSSSSSSSSSEEVYVKHKKKSRHSSSTEKKIESVFLKPIFDEKKTIKYPRNNTEFREQVRIRQEEDEKLKARFPFLYQEEKSNHPPLKSNRKWYDSATDLWNIVSSVFSFSDPEPKETVTFKNLRTPVNCSNVQNQPVEMQRLFPQLPLCEVQDLKKDCTQIHKAFPLPQLFKPIPDFDWEEMSISTFKSLCSPGHNLAKTYGFGRNVVHFVSKVGNIDLTNYLLNQNPELINSRDWQGETPLMSAILRPQNYDKIMLQTIKLLLSLNANPNIGSYEYGEFFTPLSIAIRKNKIAVIQLLIFNGAKLHEPPNLAQGKMVDIAINLLFQRYKFMFIALKNATIRRAVFPFLCSPDQRDLKKALKVEGTITQTPNENSAQIQIEAYRSTSPKIKLENSNVLPNSLAKTPEKKVVLPPQSVPLEADLLKKIPRKDMLANIDNCLQALIRSSPVNLKGKQCFVLVEDEAHWPREVPFTHQPYSWFLSFLKPALEKLSLKVPVLNYGDPEYEYLENGATADVAVVLLFSELSALIQNKNTAADSDFNEFLQKGLRCLSVRKKSASLISDSFLITPKNTPPPAEFSGYKNLCMENQLEDQYTILFKLVAKICQSSPESLQETIDCFRKGCKDLAAPQEAPKINSRLSRPQPVLASPTKKLYDFDVMMLEREKAIEKEKERTASASKELMQLITNEFKQRLANKSLPQDFYVRYDEKVFGSNSGAIKEIVDNLKATQVIMAWDMPEVEKMEKEVYKVFNDYYGEERGTEIIEIKHPAIRVKIPD